LRSVVPRRPDHFLNRISDALGTDLEPEMPARP